MFWFLGYTINVMPLSELYSPKNFAGFFRPERAQKLSVDFFSPHELTTNFRDALGDKSHKASDLSTPTLGTVYHPPRDLKDGGCPAFSPVMFSGLIGSVVYSRLDRAKKAQTCNPVRQVAPVVGPAERRSSRIK